MEERCQDNKEWAENIYWKLFERTKFHFMKDMNGDFSESMVIPKKFVKNFNIRENLPEIIGLEDPGGNQWRVRLMKEEDNLLFKEGWKEFIKAHHVEEGDRLVFKYIGDSRFSVLVFDRSDCERETSYFVKVPKKSVEDTGCHQNKEVGSVEIDLESQPPNTPAKSSKAQPADKPQGKYSSVYHCSSSLNGKIGNAESVHPNKRPRHEQTTHLPKRHAKNHLGLEPVEFGTCGQIISKRRPVTEKEKLIAIKVADEIQPTNPCFRVVMKPKHVYQTFYMTVPADFVRRHLPHKPRTIFLQLPDGEKMWDVRLMSQQNRFSCGLCGIGWREFVLDNSLEEGDVCIFKLTGSHNMNVCIVRVVEEFIPYARETYSGRKKRGRKKKNVRARTRRTDILYIE